MELKLGLTIEGDKASVFLFDDESDIILSYKEILNFNIDNFTIVEETEKSFNLNNFKINKLVVNIVSTENNLIPLEIDNLVSDENKLKSKSIKQYFNDQTIIKTYISKIDSYNYFPVSTLVYENLTSKYPQVEFNHSIDAMVKKLLYYVDEESFVYVDFLSEHIQILTIRDRKYKSINTFKCQSKDEVLYQTLKSYMDQGFITNNTSLFLSGKIEQISPVYDLLTDYIKHVKFINFNRLLHVSPEVNIFPDHYYFHSYLTIS